MKQNTTHSMVLTRRPISEADREREKSVLANLESHFIQMTGTMREAYDDMTAMTPLADRIILSEIDYHEVKGWWVCPKGAPVDRAILFLHGGAYMLGSAKAYRGLASQLAVRTGVSTFVLDYPLAPKHPFPAAFLAVSAARRWLREQGYGRLALVGDSAGAGLALGTMVSEDARQQVNAVVAFSPWIDLTFAGASFSDPATYDPIFPSPQILRNAANTYLAGADPRDGRASPLYSVPEAMPPLLIQAGTDELLFDDAQRYAEVVAARGSEVILTIYEGLHHVFQRSVTELEGARHAMDAAASFIDSHWSTFTAAPA